MWGAHLFLKGADIFIVSILFALEIPRARIFAHIRPATGSADAIHWALIERRTEKGDRLKWPIIYKANSPHDGP